MNVIQALRADYQRYSNRPPTLLRMMSKALMNAGFRAVMFYRLGHACRCRKFRLGAAICERLMHHLSHCWISTAAEIGPGFFVAHVCGIVIGAGSRIGQQCDIRQNTTLGGNFNKTDDEGRSQPTLGDEVSLGVGVVILGPVKVGDRSIVGANAVVTRDIPANTIAGGIPAKVIKERWSDETGRRL